MGWSEAKQRADVAGNDWVGGSWTEIGYFAAHAPFTCSSRGESCRTVATALGLCRNQWRHFRKNLPQRLSFALTHKQPYHFHQHYFGVLKGPTFPQIPHFCLVLSGRIVSEGLRKSSTNVTIFFCNISVSIR